MCLRIDSRATDSLRREMGSGPKVFYKTYSITNDGKLVAPVNRTFVPMQDDGTIISNRRSPALSRIEGASDEVNRGIHVYREKRACLEEDGGRIIVALEAFAVDLVGCDIDKSHCVFYKVKVDVEQLNKIIAEELRRRAGSKEFDGLSFAREMTVDEADEQEAADYEDEEEDDYEEDDYEDEQDDYDEDEEDDDEEDYEDDDEDEEEWEDVDEDDDDEDYEDDE